MKQNSNNTLGENIKKARRNKKLNQTQLAKLLDIAPQSVSSWENGNSTPTIENITELTIVLNVSFDWLVGKEPDFEDPNIIVIVIEDNIRHLNYKGLKKVEEYIEDLLKIDEYYTNPYEDRG
jgi:transcriptional regulator with XRE-family HTH domain